MAKKNEWIKDRLQPLFRTEEEMSETLRPPKRWVIYGLIVGIAFLAWSGLLGGKKDSEVRKTVQSETETEVASEEYVAQMEKRLTETLQQVRGAGRVSVLITLEGGGEKVLATDRSRKQDMEGGDRASESRYEDEEKVVLQGSRNEEAPYVVQERLPNPCGVLVVAEGAEDEAVRTALYEAVRALFGLAAHRIMICNGVG